MSTPKKGNSEDFLGFDILEKSLTLSDTSMKKFFPLLSPPSPNSLSGGRKKVPFRYTGMAHIFKHHLWV